MIIDLRSDTLTKASKPMLSAMIKAEVGDDVYKEDPTTNKLETMLAEMFGMDAALFFPSGTMANQAAIKIHTQPGEELIADKWAHVYNFEAGGAAFHSGVSCKLIDGDRGMITAEQVIESINPPDFYHSPLTSLVCLENTTNKGGGACYDFEEIKRIKQICDIHKLGLHLDGARIFNALQVKKETPKDYGEIFDTISVCLSKGLGAPIGSVLIGKKEFMQKAIRIRKILGGGMRQVGHLAAAGIYALENNMERLSEDHQRASEIAEVLKQQSFIKKVEPTETNIVIFYLADGVSEKKFLKNLSYKKIKISNMGQGKWRIVTHLDYTERMHHKLLKTLPKLNS